jgi:3-hydroxyacyl-[acyl-carrier-protein] dehydratase
MPGSHYNSPDLGLIPRRAESQWGSRGTTEKVVKFILIDKIVALEEGRTLTAVKSVSLAEEYLGDHFPTFPVLPGVLLLEGLVESASWLVRKTESFAHSMVLLAEARNVKYKSFLAPGSQIQYTVEAKVIEEGVSSFAGTGVADGQKIVEARFGLRHFNLSERNPALVAVDAQIVEEMKIRYNLLLQQRR